MHRFLLCLLLVLLPLRSLLAAGQLGCEPLQPPPMQHQQQHAGHAHHGPQAAGAEHDHAAKPCKLCAPCCLAAAPPPVVTVGDSSAAPAARVARTPVEIRAGIVPPLPDPPPRA